MELPEILIFFSDQHDPRIIRGMGNQVVRTPNLDKLIEQGTAFTSAYTSYPLCVPARMSFLTGQLPSHTGITTNQCTIPEDKATFIHSLANTGYNTVLCGRMHFEGVDQRHGFTQRFVGDQTPVLWHRTGIEAERGSAFDGTYGWRGCTRTIGYGSSPVLEYDRIVTQRAIDYLGENHEAPQAIVVGTYGPHFPYVAPKKLFEYYLEKLTIGTQAAEDDHPIHSASLKIETPERVLQSRAAYYAMIEEIDGHVGRVKRSFDEYCRRNGKPGVFIYMSDHGDMNGAHGHYGKHLFFEGSCRIPLIFSGADIALGNSMESPVSIMDIGPTICEITGSTLPPAQDGLSLVAMLKGKELPDRHVVAESVNTDKAGETYAGRMVRKGKHKLWSYAGLEAHDRLYNLYKDPDELVNLSDKEPGKHAELRLLLAEDWEPNRIVATRLEKQAQHKMIERWWELHAPETDERWRVTPESTSDLTQV